MSGGKGKGDWLATLDHCFCYSDNGNRIPESRNSLDTKHVALIAEHVRAKTTEGAQLFQRFLCAFRCISFT